MNHKLLEHRERAERLRDQYASKVAEIQGDRDLTDEAKRRRLGEVYTETKTKLDEAARAEQTLLSDRWRELHDTLFGAKGAKGWSDVGGHAVSARDASDRAARLTSPAQAAEALSRAEGDGDELMARALARHCSSMSEQAMTRQREQEWDAVVGAFIDQRPQLMGHVEELAQIEHMTKRQIFSPFSVMQPNGLAQRDLNVASTATTQHEQPQPTDGRPLVDPARTVTTHAQRVAWAEATS